MYSRATRKVIPSSEFTQMKQCESVKRACFDCFMQLNFDKILQFQHGFSKSFSKKFRFSRDSAKYFAVSRNSAKVSAKKNFQLGCSKIFCCQQEFSRFILGESTIGDKRVKWKLFYFYYWQGQPFSGFTGPSWCCTWCRYQQQVLACGGLAHCTCFTTMSGACPWCVMRQEAEGKGYLSHFYSRK